MHSDPIADMLTRIRNAVNANQQTVIVKASRICEGIAKVLKEQGYIEDYDRIETAYKQDNLRIQLKYGPLGERIFREIKRQSKTSCRVYKSVKDLPRVMGGLGICVVSTHQGVMSDTECREKNVGGELICTVC